MFTLEIPHGKLQAYINSPHAPYVELATFLDAHLIPDSLVSSSEIAGWLVELSIEQGVDPYVLAAQTVAILTWCLGISTEEADELLVPLAMSIARQWKP